MGSVCPCGSGLSLEVCCLPLINKGVPAPSPDALMRSRYAAYALGHIDYIYDTYCESQRQALSYDDIQQSAKNTVWKKLVVHMHQQDQDTGIVEFSAFYIIGKNMGVLHETSYFVRELGHWRYQHGNIHDDSGVNKVTRNQICLCNSGKKFKHCCGKGV